MKLLKNLAVVAFATVMAVSSAVSACAETILPCEKSTPSSGCVFLGIKGKYIVEAEEALDLINSYRYEACKEGVENPSTGKPLTLDDYVPIKWSSGLAEIARIRAAEASITIGHERLNGESIWFTSTGGVSNLGEVLAWNSWSEEMTTGIQQWYTEKDDWVNQTAGAVTGHYTQMIDPENTYVGLATFCSDVGTYYDTTAGEFSGKSGLDETVAESCDSCIQTVEVSTDRITSYNISGDTADGSQLSVTCNLATETYWGEASVTGDLYYLGDVTWSSSDTNTMTVSDEGVLDIKSCGTATITAKLEDGTSLSKTIKADHSYGSWTATKAATCSETGTQTRTCKVCGKTETQTVAKTDTHTASDWIISGDERYKECTVCGKVLETEVLETEISECTVSGIKSKYAYTGKAIKPEVTVTDGTKVLVNGTDYTVTYSSNKKTGKAKVKITGKGDYTGTVTKYFYIVPKKVTSVKVTSPKSKQIKVTWKKDTQATGYQIVYATNKKFTSGKKTVSISKNSTVSKTIKSLKKGKTYYVKVRAYKTINGKRIYGSYSAVKKVKCK